MEEEEADCYLRCIKPAGREKRKKRRGGALLVALSLRKLASEERWKEAQEGDERERNQIDERQENEERELEMSNRVKKIALDD